jgi:hypothetical protein
VAKLGGSPVGITTIQVPVTDKLSTETEPVTYHTTRLVVAPLDEVADKAA